MRGVVAFFALTSEMTRFKSIFPHECIVQTIRYRLDEREVPGCHEPAQLLGGLRDAQNLLLVRDLAATRGDPIEQHLDLRKRVRVTLEHARAPHVFGQPAIEIQDTHFHRVHRLIRNTSKNRAVPPKAERIEKSRVSFQI